MTQSTLCSSGRWVILHHTFSAFASNQIADAIANADERDSRRDHFDWMFSGTGEGLLTWALDRLPDFAEQTAWRLPDHRIAYLEYEGEVSGDRGSVSRVASGDYELISDADELSARVFVREKSELAKSLPAEFISVLRPSGVPPKWIVWIEHPGG